MAAVPNPIHANTLVKEANARAGQALGGTFRLSPRMLATAARTSAAATPAMPRENSGGHSRSSSLMKAQFSAQPVQVTASRARPAQRLVWFDIDALCPDPGRLSLARRPRFLPQTPLASSRDSFNASGFHSTIIACFTCPANHFKLQEKLALGGNVLEILFVLLEAVTLAAGFGLLGVFIGVRYY